MKILAKIKSVYILDILFDYIKEESFKYKLFVYSKKYQKILKINLLDYKKIYLDNQDAQFVDYIYNTDNIQEETFDKNIYEKKIEKDLKIINLIEKIWMI